MEELRTPPFDSIQANETLTECPRTLSVYGGPSNYKSAKLRHLLVILGVYKQNIANIYNQSTKVDRRIEIHVVCCIFFCLLL